MEIKPTYITFKQAKLLPNDFESIAFACYYKGEFYAHKNLLNVSGIKEDLHPIDKNEIVLAPEQWQVIEWIESNFKLYIDTTCVNSTRGDNFAYQIHKNNDTVKSKTGFDTRKEAYSAAFDYILNNLL
jgi:hypothetical protein